MMQREGVKRTDRALGKPLKRLRSVLQEMSRMMDVVHDGAGYSSGAHPGSASREWRPLVTEMPADGDIVVYFELPGVECEDIDLSLWGDSLVVSGIRKDLPSFKNVTVEDITSENLKLGPVQYAPFKRELRLPSHVEEEEIEATFGAGLLQVRVSGAAESRTRSIHIRGKRQSHR